MCNLYSIHHQSGVDSPAFRRLPRSRGQPAGPARRLPRPDRANRARCGPTASASSSRPAGACPARSKRARHWSPTCATPPAPFGGAGLGPPIAASCRSTPFANTPTRSRARPRCGSRATTAARCSPSPASDALARRARTKKRASRGRARNLRLPHRRAQRDCRAHPPQGDAGRAERPGGVRSLAEGRRDRGAAAAGARPPTTRCASSRGASAKTREGLGPASREASVSICNLLLKRRYLPLVSGELAPRQGDDRQGRRNRRASKPRRDRFR